MEKNVSSDISPLEKLFLAIRDLRKADRHSKEHCHNVGQHPDSTWAKTGWTKAAIERDRCYEYARKVAVDYFNLVGRTEEPAPKVQEQSVLDPAREKLIAGGEVEGG